MVFFSTSYQGYLVLVCLITGDSNLDLLVKVRSAGDSICKLTIFSFVISKYLVGSHFENMQIIYFSLIFHSLILSSIHEFFVLMGDGDENL